MPTDSDAAAAIDTDTDAGYRLQLQIDRTDVSSVSDFLRIWSCFLDLLADLFWIFAKKRDLVATMAASRQSPRICISIKARSPRRNLHRNSIAHHQHFGSFEFRFMTLAYAQGSRLLAITNRRYRYITDSGESCGNIKMHKCLIFPTHFWPFPNEQPASTPFFWCQGTVVSLWVSIFNI